MYRITVSLYTTRITGSRRNVCEIRRFEDAQHHVDGRDAGEQQGGRIVVALALVAFVVIVVDVIVHRFSSIADANV